MHSSDDDRIARLEREVDFLFRRLGTDPDLALAQDDSVAVAALVRPEFLLEVEALALVPA